MAERKLYERVVNVFAKSNQLITSDFAPQLRSTIASGGALYTLEWLASLLERWTKVYTCLKPCTSTSDSGVAW